MSLIAWQDPVIDTGQWASIEMLNNNLHNLRTLHAHDDDPPVMIAHMLQVRTDLEVLRIRNAANNAWIDLGKIEANLGMLRADGSTPLLADLDCDGFSLLDPLNAAASGSPVGNPDMRVGIVIGSTTYWVPAWAATF